MTRHSATVGLRGGASALSTEDRLKLLLPGWLYYPYKIAKEGRRNEPELLILRDIVRAGCTAIDAGANRGVYSHALSRIARRVEAFEPNPAIAKFARSKLGRNVQLHELALSDRNGTATFHVPHSKEGHRFHLLGSLHRYPESEQDAIEIRIATLDSFEFRDVGFIKIDVEGSELEVIDGGKRTIARDRPTLLVELLKRPADELLAAMEWIEALGYQSWILAEGDRLPARALLHEPIANTNVLFTPR